MATDYAAILGKKNLAYNVGGYTQDLLFMPIRWLDTFTRPLNVDDAGATSPSDFVEVTDLIPTTGKGLYSLRVTRDSASSEESFNTERDTSGKGQLLKFKVAGDDLVDQGLLTMLENEECIILAKSPGAAKYEVFGSDQFGCEVKIKRTSGNNQSGYRGAECEAHSFEVTKFYFTGTAPLHP
jgi:hypothetical protein